MNPIEEMVDVVDEADRVTGQVTRGEMRRRNLRHRAAYVLVFNDAGQLFVHRRSAAKDVYPSQYDLAAGGVLGAGESYAAAARRELAEELGVAGVPLRPLFPLRYTQADGVQVNGEVFSCTYNGELRLQPAEVEDGQWLDLDAVMELAQRQPVCPDSLHALRLYLGYLDSAARRKT